ncbi:uncharacterized protein LOC119578475 [Penaeus monodon]|uniref:uncharacterized protein LOC119578475 n=1 Tax=Penaeus monodon TaxID=6687 RepID=UPI0018A7AA01|nr:uncharacterized protein LOC119578475 [Penaeus monodon]
MPRLSKMTIVVVLSLAVNLYLLCTVDIDVETLPKFREAPESRYNEEQSPYLLLTGLEWDENEQSYVNSLTMPPEEIIKVMEKTSRNLPIAFIERNRDKVYHKPFVNFGLMNKKRRSSVMPHIATFGTSDGTSIMYVTWSLTLLHAAFLSFIATSFHKLSPSSSPHVILLLTAMRVIYNPPENETQQGDFAVCVKGFDFYFQDNTKRLVEWLELLSALGAHKVFYYSLGMNAKMEKMMKYYEDKGFVEVIPTTLPASQPNIPGLFFKYVFSRDKFQHEVIQLNDCYYRNLYRYKYTVHLDTDEVIVPRFALTWQHLMQTVTKKSAKDNLPYVSYCARHTYYMDHMRPSQEWLKDVPSHLHMLQHVIRSANYSGIKYSVKCFHSTAGGLHLHNHYPLLALGKTFPYAYNIPTHDAQLNHYRQNCHDYVMNCYETFTRYTVIDPVVWKYKDKLITEVNKTFSYLGYW